MQSATRITVAALFVASVPNAQVWAAEATYPSRPIRLILPNQAGSANDTINRIVGVRMGELLGHSIVIDNRPGAGGLIGMETAAQALPDGYTLAAISPTTHAINPQIQPKLTYRPFDDFAPISPIAISRNVLVVHPGVPAQSVKELIALAKARPGSLNMASSGSGSQSHLSGVLFNVMAGIDAMHVPYKGAGGSVNAIVSGEAQYTINPAPAVMQHVRSGRMRALGVSGTRRMAELPQVPTIAEAGVPGYTVSAWFGLAAPRATPKAVIARLHQAVVATAATPDIEAQLVKIGAEPFTMTPDAFAKFMREEYERFKPAVRAAKLTIQ